LLLLGNASQGCNYHLEEAPVDEDPEEGMSIQEKESRWIELADLVYSEEFPMNTVSDDEEK